MKFIAKKLVAMVELIEKISSKIHVFHIEDAFVIITLIITLIIARGNYIEWIGSVAVFIGFKHAVIAFRLEEVVERQKTHGDTAFNSHGKQTQYFYAKEILWFVYFILLGAWSGLIGVVLFLSYPIWHKIREEYHSKSATNRKKDEN